MPNIAENTFPSVTREKLRKNPNAKEVAKELDLHISTVYRHAGDMDLAFIRELKKSEWDIKEIINYMSLVLCLSPTFIAKKLGYTVQYISQVLSEKDEVGA